MEVAELTASLNIAGLQGFLSGLASADRAVNELRGDLEKLAAAAELAKAAMADLGAPASAVGKQAALNAELKKTRDLLAEIKALSGFEGGGGVSAGARVAAPVNLGGLASNRYGLLGALLGQDAAMQYNNYLLQQARRDASSAGLEGALFGAQQATVTQREVVTAVKTATESAPVAAAVAAGAAAGGGGGGVAPPAVAAAAAGDGGGGWRNSALAAALGFGAGNKAGGFPLPWFLGGRFLGNVGGGLAGFGTLGGLAGFGAEHVLTSGLGIGGSLLGGVAGGGLLAGGALGTAAVGIGTDLAGIGQAGGDIKTVTGDLTSLQNAIKEYGAASTQAAAAQAQLNLDLGSFNPVARSAVLAASQQAQTFHALFNAATGEAEKTGAQILQQAMQTGEAFLPTIGTFAAQNLGIIQKDIQPFFTWLQNSSPQGGLGVFTQLEQIFQSNLPAGVNALSQGLELFVRTIGVAASQTGDFTQKISDFLTKLNTTGFQAWSDEVVKLINLFKTWVGTFASFGSVIYALFKPAVGFGAAFATMLTGIFDQIDGWLNKSSTQDLLHGLFAAHFTEVIKGIGGLFTALLPVLEDAATAFIKIATAMTDLVNLALVPLVDGIKKLFSYGWVAWAAGIVLALFAVKGALAGVIGLFGVDLGVAAATGASQGIAALGSEGLLGSINLLIIRLQFLKANFLGFLGEAAAALAPYAAILGVTVGAPAALGAAAAYATGGRIKQTPVDVGFNGGFFETINNQQRQISATQAAQLGVWAVLSPSARAALVRQGFTPPSAAASAAARAAATPVPAGALGNPLSAANLAATNPTNEAAFAGFLKNIQTTFTQATHPGSISLANIQLPFSIRSQMAALSAKGNLSAANSLAYGYISQYLKIPGLTAQQRYQVNQQLAQFAPLGSVPSATSANAAGAGSVASIYQVPASFQTAIDQANVLAAQGAPGAVAAEIKANQAAATAALAAARSFPVNSQNQQAALQQAAGFLQTVQSLKGTGAGQTGGGFFSADRQARLVAAAQNITGITATTAPTSTSITALTGDVTQTSAALKILQQRLKDNAYAGAQFTNAQTEATTLLTQENAAKKLLAGQRASLKIEELLNIAGPRSTTGAEAARTSSQNLRDFLNTTLQKFGLGTTGSSALGPFVTELHKLGDINNSQFMSLEKILQTIKELKKDTGVVADWANINSDLSDREKQIKDELSAGTGFANLYRAPRGFSLRGLSAGQAEAVASALEHHGTAPVGGAAGGVGILPNGKVATAANAREYFASSITGLPSHVSGRYSSGGPAQVTININGYNKDPIAFATEVAARVGEIQSRTAYRNNTQVRGAFAGLAKPFQW